MAFRPCTNLLTLPSSKSLHLMRYINNRPMASFKYDALESVRTKSPKPKPAGKDLTFGKDVTDHMLIASWNANKGWSAPKIQPVQPLTLDPTAKTFQFAAHIFEGMKAFYREDTGQIMMFRPDKNAERFLSSALRCSLPGFDTQEFVRCIARLVDTDRDWVPRGVPHAALYIRPVLIGTEANFKVGPPKDALMYALLSPVASYFKTAATKPVRLYADPNYVRAWPGGVGAYKMGSNYGPAVYVQAEAEKQGCEQALWLFGDDLRITEVGSMNVITLWYNQKGEKELVTAPLDSGLILPGVTRDSLLTLAREWTDADSIKVSEREHTLPEVLKALKEGRLIEMFGCGTAAVVTPVSEILFEGTVHHLPISKQYSGPKEKNGKPLADQTVSGRLLQELQDIQYGRRKHEWAIDVKDLI